MTARRRPPVAILIALAGLGPLALNIFMPSMPGMQAVFGVDYGTIQFTLTLYLIGTAAAQLVYGPLSDRFGRRPVLLAGLALFFAGSLACAAAAGIATLIAGRMVQSVGAAAGLVLGRAIVRDMHDRERSASVLAYITMAMVVVPMLAPMLGGVLDVWGGWRASFAVVAACGAVALAVAVAVLHETHHQRAALDLAGMLASYRALAASPAFWSYTANTAFSSAVFFAFLGGAPYVMIEVMGRSPGEYGAWFAIASLGYMAGNFFAGRRSAHLGSDRMIAIGSAVTLLGALALAGVALAGWMSPAGLFLPMLVMAFGNGTSLPNGIAGAVSVEPRAAGAAAGLSGFMQMVTGAAASLLVGHLLADSAAPMVAVMLAAAAAAFLVFRLVPRHR